MKRIISTEKIGDWDTDGSTWDIDISELIDYLQAERGNGANNVSISAYVSWGDGYVSSYCITTEKQILESDEDYRLRLEKEREEKELKEIIKRDIKEAQERAQLAVLKSKYEK